MAKEKFERTKPHVNRTTAAWGFFSIVLLFLLSFCFYQCDNEEVIGEPPLGLLYGTVTDSMTNLPLEAWVGYDSVLDTSLGIFEFSDSNGYYRIRKFPPGNGELYCGKESYQTQVKEFYVAGLDSTNIDFKLLSR